MSGWDKARTLQPLSEVTVPDLCVGHRGDPQHTSLLPADRDRVLLPSATLGTCQPNGGECAHAVQAVLVGVGILGLDSGCQMDFITLLMGAHPQLRTGSCRSCWVLTERRLLNQDKTRPSPRMERMMMRRMGPMGVRLWLWEMALGWENVISGLVALEKNGVKGRPGGSEMFRVVYLDVLWCPTIFHVYCPAWVSWALSVTNCAVPP